METKNWRYQVWMHCCNEKTVTLTDSYKNESWAYNTASMMNAMVRRDTPPGMPQERFYFVHPVSEEQFIEDIRERFRRRKNKDKNKRGSI